MSLFDGHFAVGAAAGAICVVVALGILTARTIADITCRDKWVPIHRKEDL